MAKVQLKGTRRQIAERFILLDGRPYSLENYPPFHDIVNRYDKQVLYMAARQVSKSTNIAVSIITDGMITPHWKSLYVAPSQNQRNVFSTTRLGKIIRYSPLVEKYFSAGEDSADQVGHKMWQNGSEIYLSYASLDPDRIRGISSMRNYFDEVQDIDYDAVIPVVNETMAASPHGSLVTYGGTPKTMESAIQALWEGSTQGEWLIKCTGCSKHNIMGLKNVGKKGPICAHCGKLLNVREGFWHHFNSTSNDAELIRGYRIPQIILPLHTEHEIKWRELLAKLEGPNCYSASKIKNELFGMSDSIGARMITQEDLHKFCSARDLSPVRPSRGAPTQTFAGIDWSGEGKNSHSHTSLWIWEGRNANSLETLYYKVFSSGHPIQDIEEIATLCAQFGCSMVFGDKGGGAHANALLSSKIGEHRVSQVMYGSYTKPLTWNNSSMCYQTDKTSVIDSFFIAAKRGAFKWCNIGSMQQAFNHFLAEYEEVTKGGDGRRVWRRSSSKPDDALHAAVFGWLAAKAFYDDLSLYS